MVRRSEIWSHSADRRAVGREVAEAAHLRKAVRDGPSQSELSLLVELLQLRELKFGDDRIHVSNAHMQQHRGSNRIVYVQTRGARPAGVETGGGDIRGQAIGA